MPVIDIKNATVYIQDGTSPTPNRIEVKIGEGNFTWSEKVNREYILDRGTLDLVRNGDEVPMDVSFDFTWEYIRGGLGSGDPASVDDALKNQGNASGWVSSSADACEPYAVDILVYNEPNCSTGDKELTVFSDFRYESIDADLRAGRISVKGRCNSTKPTSTRHLNASSVI